MLFGPIHRVPNHVGKCNLRCKPYQVALFSPKASNLVFVSTSDLFVVEIDMLIVNTEGAFNKPGLVQAL